MAERTDVNEMFQKMGEKLGWFKHNNSDEAKNAVTLSAKKKTKVKKGNVDTVIDDSKSNGKKTDKLKLKKKKTKVTGDASKQSDKSGTLAKQTLLQTKAQSFKVLLSSDSDSSFTDIPKQKVKTGNGKAVLQVCSDSDDDLAHTGIANNNSNACIKESFVDAVEGIYVPENMSCPKFEPILDVKPKRESDIDYNDTVVKNRVSLASCTLDLDNLGEPLVESTRIHRRSSITYKRIIEDLDSSAEDCKVVENTNTFRREKLADEMMDHEASVCDETNYVTATEIVDDTLNSSQSNHSNGKFGDRAPIKEMRKKPDNLREEKKNDNHICKIRSPIHSDKSESEEEVEVMDTATQTDEVVIADIDSLEQTGESDKKVHRAYKEETILDTQGKLLDFYNRYRTTDMYDEDTVQDSHAIAESRSLQQVSDALELSNSEKEQLGVSLYTNITVIEDKLASTTISTHVHDYSKETVGHESKSFSKTDVFNNTTGLDNNTAVYDQETNITDSGHNHFEAYVPLVGVNEDLQETNNGVENVHEEITDGEINSTESETKSEAEESIYEVNDAGTQTEELYKVERASADEEQKESDQSNVEAGSSEDELKEKEQNECSGNDESVSKNEADFIRKKKMMEDISDESDTSERSREDISARTSDSSDSSDAISASFAKLAEKSRNKKQKKVDVTDQSWRSSRRFSSDSSSDGDLEAFFQKLKKPEQKKSDSSSPMRYM
ncbi:dentin sialophosphoprotein-like [Mercenaria mercenaria]|uniref:dentin sialophosphoprotein-like n=1 Tax=Mercenaria mercenaria TaxID=6596 RepID=UPI00234E80DE|nr:dentin sialophosphoprotein-like [Mercenaria mercenaria]